MHKNIDIINFEVCTFCITYNQSKYIQDAMNGFCIQKTTFPYVCCILDDASADGEPEVIRQYLKEHFDLEDKSVVRKEDTEDYVFTFAQHKTNRNCYFAVFLLKYNHHKIKSKKQYISEWQSNAKYFAICEGDDYWIDSLKLQKQFDYMESHSRCSYLFTDRYIDFIRLGIRKEIRYKKNVYTKQDVLRGFIPGVQTVFFRKEILDDEKFNKVRGVNGDRLYAYFACFHGEIHCLHEITAVYRATGEGVSTSISQDVLYKHLVDDIYRFHHNLGVNDFWSYYYLQGRQIGNARGANLLRKCQNICKTMKALDTSFKFYYLPILIFFYLLRRFKDRFNLGDPRKISHAIE